MRGSTMRESVTDVRIILECLQEACRLGQRVKVRERHFWEVYFQESLNRLEQ